MSNDIYADKIIPVSSRKISIDSGVNITGDTAISGSLTATNPETGTSGSLVFSSDFTKCLGSSISGLTLSNSSGDTDHDITIATGYCIDSTGTYILRLTSPITKQLDAAWTNGTNAGGMQTGSSISATTEYFIWLIRRDSDGYVDAVGSPSMTSPTLPTGYTYKRLLRGTRTDGSANIVNNQWLITDVVNDRSANIVVSYTVSKNTAGGSSTAGAYYTRPINTVAINEIPGASLASNQVTLPAGTYRMWANCSMYYPAYGITRLYNATAAAMVLLGTCINSSIAVDLNIQGQFTLSVASALELQYICSNAVGTTGLGYQTNLDVETYLKAQFIKIG